MKTGPKPIVYRRRMKIRPKTKVFGIRMKTSQKLKGEVLGQKLQSVVLG